MSIAELSTKNDNYVPIRTNLVNRNTRRRLMNEVCEHPAAACNETGNSRSPNYAVTLLIDLGLHSDCAKVHAAMVIISIPILVFYMFGQRYLEWGLAGGGLKG